MKVSKPISKKKLPQECRAVPETQEAQAAPRARGRWTKENTTVQYPAATDTVEIHTYAASSGYTAVMKRTLGRGREPYTAEIRNPDGTLASRINDHGHRMTSMAIQLNQRDARLTVEEAIHQIQALPLQTLEHQPDQLRLRHQP